MIHFNDLRYNETKTSIIIEAQIEKRNYFVNSYLTDIFIDTQDTFVPNGPSSKCKLHYQVPQENNKLVSIEIPVNSIGVNPSKDILFVYVKGVSGPEVPCELNKELIIGTVIDLQGVYSNIMRYIKQMGETCTIPRHLINEFLKYKLLDICVKSGNYALVVKYWNKYNANCHKNIESNKSCQCYG